MSEGIELREAVARKLCEQIGGDPDAVASEPHDCWEGLLWTQFTKEADEIIALIIGSKANALAMVATPELLRSLRAIFYKMDRKNGAPGHLHDVPGIWDADNAPGVAGTRCEWCAQWEAARTAIAKAAGEA